MKTKAFARIPILSTFLGLLLFIPAGTIHFWQAWVFLTVFTASLLGMTAFLAIKAPKLLERRLNSGPAAEKQGIQKILHFLLSKSLILAALIPGLDHRYHWSNTPLWVIVAGNVCVALGFLIVTLVFRENAYAFATVEVVSDQRVISTGPYAWVRHPMYAGLLITFLGIPLSLASWWGLVALGSILIILICRLKEEEKFLATHLPGYSAYKQKVPFRLAPLVW